MQVLERAAQASKATPALDAAHQNWQTWREGDLREAREVVQEHNRWSVL